MGKELERREVSVVSRRTARELAAIRDERLISRAAVQARESAAACQAYNRIENGYALADHTVWSASLLSRQITVASRDNPALEMNLRGLEEDVAIAARSIIYRYMTRP